MVTARKLFGVLTGVCMALLVAHGSSAQTREKGPWWPSKYGPADQAGNTNTVTPQKILEALTIAKTGKTYELGHVYEPNMPQYGVRPYYLQSIRRDAGAGVVYTEYFTGFIGQMGTQFDGFGHQGRKVKMADGSEQAVYYNGFTEQELTGKNRGQGGLEVLGVEHMKPIITRGILIDVAGYKGVPTLPAAYEVTMADVKGALARQGMSEASVREGDAVLFNLGWSANFGNPSKYNDSFVGKGENKGSPGIYAEVGKWLIEKQVSMVGADNCCVEVRPTPGTSNVHYDLLTAGVPMLENMELRELAQDRAYEFLFLTLPERIKGASGSPVRPIAIR
jgi:kynurenine formamidase